MNKINQIELDQNYWTSFQAESTDELITIAKSVGQIIPSRKNSNDLIDILSVNKKENANPKSLSALYGEKSFPYHTDGAYLPVPPKYLILRSPKQINDCPTKLCIPKFNDDDKRVLIKNVWLVNGGRGKFYSSIIGNKNNDFIIRFDLACMKPALDEFISSINIMEKTIKSSKIQLIDWKSNQCIIFNNWKLVHARADATKVKSRILERVWIKN